MIEAHWAAGIRESDLVSMELSRHSQFTNNVAHLISHLMNQADSRVHQRHEYISSGGKVSDCWG